MSRSDGVPSTFHFFAYLFFPFFLLQQLQKTRTFITELQDNKFLENYQKYRHKVKK